MQNNLQRFHSTGVPCRGLSIASNRKKYQVTIPRIWKDGCWQSFIVCNDFLGNL